MNRTASGRPEFEYNYSGTNHSEYYSESESRSYQFNLRYNLSPKTNPSYKILGFSEKWKHMPTGLSGLEVTPLPDKINLVLANQLLPTARISLVDPQHAFGERQPEIVFLRILQLDKRFHLIFQGCSRTLTIESPNWHLELDQVILRLIVVAKPD